MNFQAGIKVYSSHISGVFLKFIKYRLPRGPTEVSQLNFPEFLVFNAFIRICYFTFIIPFRVLKGDDGKYQLHTNIIQQLISTVLVASSTIYSLLSIRLLFRMDLKKNPSEAFAVIFGMMRKASLVAWFFTFWIHRDYFHKLLLVCQTTASPSTHLIWTVSKTMLPSGSVDAEEDAKNRANWKVIISARLVMFFATIKLAAETYHTFANWNDPNWMKPYQDEKSGQNLSFFNYVLKANLKAGWTSLQWNSTADPPETGDLFQENFIERSFETFVFMALGTTQDYICNMIDAFCFIGAAIMYSICERFVREIPMKKKDGVLVDESIQDPTKFMKLLERASMNFVELKSINDATNDIFGPLFLLYILGAFPSLMGFMMFKQYGSVTGVQMGGIAIASCVIMHVIVGVVASEGSSMMADYKIWLFESSLQRKKPSVWKPDFTNPNASEDTSSLSNATLSRLNHLHREVSSDAIGLKGCGFFTMSYGLIGTLLGIFVTFAIVIVQFEMDRSGQNKGKT